MAYLALVIAIVAAAAGVYLWRVDARQRAQTRELEAPEAEVAESAEDSEDHAAAWEEETEEPETHAAAWDDEKAESEPRTAVREEEAEQEPELEIIDAEVEGEEVTEEPEQQEEPEEPETSEDADDAEESVEPALRTAVRPRSGGLQLPGATRRERKAWAEENEFDFVRRDEFLVDEWSRGAASTGAPARDIVSGAAYGHELLLMDLDGVNVMAMRTGAASDLVVDIRRDEFDDPSAGDTDLMRVAEVEGFTVYATEVGVGERLLDVRVLTALAQMPPAVTAVWMESDWVLAQTTGASRRQDWEDMLAPLALLADAARVLPPREHDADAAEGIVVTDFTPSRPVAHPPASDVLVAVPAPPGPDESELVETPPVVRPEEPLEMPTRTRAEHRGTVPPRAVGVDEVDAIADGRRVERQEDGTRMPRRFTAGPSIFDDGERD